MRLAERLELLTRDFVDTLFAAMTSSLLEEVRPELAQRQRDPRARAATPAKAKKAASRPGRPTKGRHVAPVKQRRTDSSDEEPRGEHMITNPEALLRAAFGDVSSEPSSKPTSSRATSLLSSSGQERTSESIASRPASESPAQPVSRIGRVIRRTRTG